MNFKPSLEIIELVTILIGAILAVLGALTDVKTKTGRLTKWGIIAIAGIIISNSFSIYETYRKEKDDNTLALKKSRDSTAIASLETQRFKSQARVADSIIRKSDSALLADIDLQKKTSTLLDEAKASLINENTIDAAANNIKGAVSKSLDLQAVLENQTNELKKSAQKVLDDEAIANENIKRSLNPLTPFGVTFTLKIRLVDSITERYQFYKNSYDHNKFGKANATLMQIINKPIPKSTGIFGDFYNPVVGAKYIHKEDFAFLQKIPITINIWRKNAQTGIRGNISAEIKPSFKDGSETEFASDTLYNSDVFSGIHLEYNKKETAYYVTYFSNSIRYVDDRKLIGINDLSGCLLRLSLGSGVPIRTELVSFTFHFPPAYSTTYRVTIVDKGRQVYAAHPFLDAVNELN